MSQRNLSIDSTRKLISASNSVFKKSVLSGSTVHSAVPRLENRDASLLARLTSAGAIFLHIPGLYASISLGFMILQLLYERPVRGDVVHASQLQGHLNLKIRAPSRANALNFGHTSSMRVER